jgi:phage tail sheath gpL-like
VNAATRSSDSIMMAARSTATRTTSTSAAVLNGRFISLLWIPATITPQGERTMCPQCASFSSEYAPGRSLQRLPEPADGVWIGRAKSDRKTEVLTLTLR